MPFLQKRLAQHGGSFFEIHVGEIKNACAPMTVGPTPAVDKLDTVEHDSTEVVVRLSGVYGASELGCGFRF